MPCARSVPPFRWFPISLLNVHLDCESADEDGGQHDAVASEEGAVWLVSGGVRVVQRGGKVYL